MIGRGRLGGRLLLVALAASLVVAAPVEAQRGSGRRGRGDQDRAELEQRIRAQMGRMAMGLFDNPRKKRERYYLPTLEFARQLISQDSRFSLFSRLTKEELSAFVRVSIELGYEEIAEIERLSNAAGFTFFEGHCEERARNALMMSGTFNTAQEWEAYIREKTEGPTS